MKIIIPFSNLLFLIIIGCSNTPEKPEVSNFEFKSEVLERELEFLNKNPQDSLGLALSGGGVRSASFSIGLMTGLNNGKILQDFDYISSVSGGSYAALWYYSKLYWNHIEREKGNNEPIDNIFKLTFRMKKDEYKLEYELDQNGEHKPITNEKMEKYRFQRSLNNNTKLLRYQSANSDNALDSFVSIGAAFWRFIGGSISRIPSILIPNRLIKNNYSLYPKYYRNSLERIYGFYPYEYNITGIHYPYKKNMWGNLSNEQKEKWNKDKDGYLNNKTKWRLDEFKFNNLSESLFSKNSKNAPPIWIINTTADVNNLWPRWRNSPDNAPKYKETIFEFTPFYYGNNFYGYSDTENLKENISHIVQLSGAAVDSANPYNSGGEDFVSAFFPLGNYIEINNENNDKSYTVYLTDGGHSDNLGVYSLVRRGVGTIIISDAEQDENGNLGGLIRLIQKLKEEGYTLTLNQLSLGSKLETHDYNTLPLPLVLRGEITKENKKISTIYYVKLRLVADHMGNKSSSELSLENANYSENLKEHFPLTNEKFNEKFPHDPTADIGYSATMYQSYFKLGEHLGRYAAELINPDQ